MANFEMKALDKFQIKGTLVVVGEVVNGTIAVADKVTISNGVTAIDSVVIGVIVDQQQLDSFTYSGQPAEIGLVLHGVKRTDLKGMIEQYSVVSA